MAASWAFRPGGLATIDPSLIAYAPPGYPILVGLVTFLLGPSDQPSFLVSAVLGTLTIPLVAWISGRIFGPRASVVSAWCLCFSGPHLAFSRMGLTDTSFLFFFSLAFAAGLRFLERPRFGTALMMGALVGLAQQFKYNGWLSGAVVIFTVILGPLVSKGERDSQRWLRLSGWGGFAILIAWMIVYPWFRFVESHGGYSALLAHQRSYLNGWSAWMPNLFAQANQATRLVGPIWLTLGAGLAIGVSIWVTSPLEKGTARTWLLSSIVAGCLLTTVLVAPITSGILLIPGLRWNSRVGDRFIGASWLALLVLSPFYHPYARLWLPFEMIHWIIVGGLASNLDEFGGDPALVGRHRIGRGWLVGSLGLTGLGFLIFGPGFPFASTGRFSQDGLFDPSDSLRVVASDVAKQIPAQCQGIRTLVRPALSFYLAGRIVAFPQSGLDSFDLNPNNQRWGLIDSSLISNELDSPGRPDHRALPDRLRSRWELVQEFPSKTSLPTILDLDPHHPGRPRDQSLTYLWLVRPRALGLER